MDNLMLNGAADQYEAGLRSAEELADADERDTNIDGFTDWLCQCGMYQKPVVLPCLRNTREAVEEWADEASVQELIAGLLSPRADVRELSATYLRDKWMDQA